MLRQGERHLVLPEPVRRDGGRGDIPFLVHPARPVQPVDRALELGASQEDLALEVLVRLTDRPLLELADSQLGDLHIQVGLQLVGLRAFECDPLQSQQLFVIRGIEFRQHVAALDDRTLGNHAEQDRCPARRQPLSPHADGDVLELALDDGPFSAFDATSSRAGWERDPLAGRRG